MAAVDAVASLETMVFRERLFLLFNIIFSVEGCCEEEVFFLVFDVARFGALVCALCRVERKRASEREREKRPTRKRRLRTRHFLTSSRPDAVTDTFESRRVPICE